jgi:hypothetical protein
MQAKRHKRPRKPQPSPITDSVIVDLMLRGAIEIRNEFTTPEVYTNGKLRKLEFNEQGGRNRIHGGCRWRINIKFGGHQRRIMLSRLLWLWYFLTIPPEHEIHHLNESGTEDRIGNLACWTSEEHHAYHYGRSNDGEF